MQKGKSRVHMARGTIATPKTIPCEETRLVYWVNAEGIDDSENESDEDLNRDVGQV